MNYIKICCKLFVAIFEMLIMTNSLIISASDSRLRCHNIKNFGQIIPYTLYHCNADFILILLIIFHLHDLQNVEASLTHHVIHHQCITVGQPSHLHQPPHQQFTIAVPQTDKLVGREARKCKNAGLRMRRFCAHQQIM